MSMETGAATATNGMKFTRIPRNRDLHKKRVAAYCRVSTLLEEQEDSFDSQVS